MIDPDVFWANRRGHCMMRNCPDPDWEQEIDQLIELLRSMLRMNPVERPRIEELLSHKWFSDTRVSTNDVSPRFS